MLSEGWLQQLHARLLSGDPVAPSELALAVIEPLVSALVKKRPNIPRDNLFEDAVTDAFMNYVKDPSRYDSTKRGLFGYLLMSAEGDLLNAVNQRKRRSHRETPMEDVELDRAARKVSKSEEDHALRMDTERVKDKLNQLVTDPMDRELLQLLLSGERTTAAFVQVLGLVNMSPSEERRQVKKHKDRLKKKLERLGGILRAE